MFNDTNTPEVKAAPVAAETSAPAPAADGERPQRQQRPPFQKGKRKKVCIYCVDKNEKIDYKAALKLKKFTSDRGKILPRRVSGACAMHQRAITTAIKTARHMALLPYTAD